MPEVCIRPRSSFTPDELETLSRWLERAYDEPPHSWPAEHWEALGPVPHLTVERDGELLAHACIAWVPVDVAGERVLAGYVEDVATRADVRGRGLATALMRAARPLIEDGAALGLLATGSLGFYERLGWVRWRGPTAVVEADGSVTPTPEEDEWIMALLLPNTPPSVRPGLPIVRPRRDAIEPW
jgi:aminoglycoside 2'-N-acetyltransferase I